MDAEILFDLTLLSSAQRVEEGEATQTCLQHGPQDHWGQVSHFTRGSSATSWEEVRAELSVEQGHQFPSELKLVLQSLLEKKRRAQGGRYERKGWSITS